MKSFVWIMYSNLSTMTYFADRWNISEAGDQSRNKQEKNERIWLPQILTISGFTEETVLIIFPVGNFYKGNILFEHKLHSTCRFTV